MSRMMSLKCKLTIASAVVLTALCTVFAVSSIVSAYALVDAAVTVPAQSIAGVPAAGLIVEEAAAPDADVPVSAALGQFRGTAVWTMVLLIALGSLLTYALAAKTLKPLEQLTEAVGAIGVNSLDEKIPVPGTGDEVDRLTESFNGMIVKLGAAYQAQKNFAANAAHELRTPLALIQAQIDVFQMREDRGAEEYDALLRSIGESTDRLSCLVGDLPSFTAEQDVDMTEQVNLRELLEEIVFELEGPAADRRVRIEVSGEGVVLGDDRLLQRAFYNLVSNAMRYNVAGGSVAIRISEGGVAVADAGMGIPDEAKPSVFDPLFCVDKSRSRELGGGGLGLAIAKSIVERHGGRITVEDNRPQGSVFAVSFGGR